MTVAYAFIDGNAFERTVEKILTEFDCKFEDINWAALTRNASRIFYFDALPEKKERQSEVDFHIQLTAKKSKFSKLRRVTNMHVREGLTRYRKSSGTLSQKGVDIALAVEVLTHAFSGNIHCARIFASDLDFFPLLDALTNTKVRSELYYGPTRTPSELIEAADFAEPINHFNLLLALPDLKRSTFGPSGISVDISEYQIIQSGSNEFGLVSILGRNGEGKFVLKGMTDAVNPYVHMSGSKEVLIEHFELCARSPIVWI